MCLEQTGILIFFKATFNVLNFDRIFDRGVTLAIEMID